MRGERAYAGGAEEAMEAHAPVKLQPEAGRE
jgi:hypothetical protein